MKLRIWTLIVFLIFLAGYVRQESQAEEYGVNQQWQADRQMQHEMEQAVSKNRLQRIEEESQTRMKQMGIIYMTPNCMEPQI